MKKTIYYADENFKMNYVVYTKDGANISELPLIIYLHGAGERGLKVDHLSRHGIPKFLDMGREYDATFLCPQCPCDRVWDNVVNEVKAIIDNVVKEYGIKKDRICITGSSMGGFGTWMMGLTFTNFFAGIAPIAGGGMSWRGGNLRSTPVLAAHGDADNIVPIIYSQLMVDRLKSFGADAELITLEGFGHNDGINEAYENETIINWLLKQRRTDYSDVPEAVSDCF